MHDASAPAAPDDTPNNPAAEPSPDDGHQLAADQPTAASDANIDAVPAQSDPAPVTAARRPPRTQQVLTAMVLVLIVASFMILAIEIASQ